MVQNKKASIILVLKVLAEYTDRNHYLTQKEIGDIILDRYAMELERKSIGSSLAILQDLDYDILKGPKGGFALDSRTFDSSEVKFLIDAIFSSKSISGKQAKSLCDKLSSLLSRHEKHDYQYLMKTTQLTRTNNKNVFYNIEIINEAIKTNKWIGFKYLSYDEDGNLCERFNGYTYHASPCYLVNNFGKYYLLAYRYKYDSVGAFRLDLMSDVYVMDERVRINPSELKEFNKYNSFSEYLNDHIYLFGGEVIEAEMELDDPKSLSYIKEWFGENAKISKVNDTLKAKVKCNEQAFFYWIMQYGEHFKLLSPESMIQKIKDTSKHLLDTYK